jgi:hypothetical protein
MANVSMPYERGGAGLELGPNAHSRRGRRASARRYLEKKDHLEGRGNGGGRGRRYQPL